jgi:radical SAM superfamily enzyme YgiQ (UPF0313 family)
MSSNPRVLLCTVYRRFSGVYVEMINDNFQHTPWSPCMPRTACIGLRFIKRNVPEVELLEYPNWDEYKAKLAEGWDVVGFSCYQSEITEIERMISEARRQGVREIWAGNYGALDPHLQSLVDRAVIGPGENAVAELFGHKVSDGQIKHPVVVQDLCINHGKIKLLSMGLIYTRHGCPNKCNFCQAAAFGGGHTSNINEESIELALRKLRSMGIRHIMIYDETFGADRKTSDRITQLFARYKFQWFPLSRAEVVLHNLDTWCKRGFMGVNVGVEVVSQQVLDSINKKQKVEEIVEFARRTKEKGIYRMINYLVGHENMDEADTLRDVRRLAEMGFDVFAISILTPLPQTPMRDRIDSTYGIFDHDYRHYNTEHLVWNHPYITPERMRSLHREAHQILNRPFKTAGGLLRRLMLPQRQSSTRLALDMG